MPYKDLTSEKARETHIKSGKKYYENNKTNILKKNKLDPRRIKSSRINNWKRRGLIGDLDIIYEKYLSTNNCEKCFKPFIDSKDKCLDHNHNTNEFRFILCRNCNNWDNFLKTDNSSKN